MASTWAYMCSILTVHSNHSLCLSIPQLTYLICSVHQALAVKKWLPFELIWVKMPRKNNGLFDVLFSQSLWIKCVLLCFPGRLELDCSWKAPQCESPQVISLAKSKYLYIFGIFFWQTLNSHYSSTVKVFDLIPKVRASPGYQLSSGSKYTACLASAFHPDRNLL